MFINTEAGYIFAEVVNPFKSTPLFLLPGGPGFDHLSYKLNQPQFEKHFTTVYHDPRGCGQSLDFSQSSMYLDANIEDIERIRSYLGVTNIMLLGTSYGSMVALGYATKYPQYVSKLILVGGAPSYHFLETAQNNLMNKGTPEQIKTCNMFLWKGHFIEQIYVDQFFKVMRPLYSKRVAKDPTLAEISNPHIQCRLAPLNYAFRTKFWQFDFTNQLKNITCKTSIMFGREDWINDPMYAEIMHANIPNSTLTYFDAAHSIAFDCPTEYFDSCKKFLMR